MRQQQQICEAAVAHSMAGFSPFSPYINGFGDGLWWMYSGKSEDEIRDKLASMKPRRFFGARRSGFRDALRWALREGAM
jgi:hypothetical protein